MLEQYRKSGKPIPPQVEKMAEWLNKMEDDSAQDVPMVKPGVRNGNSQKGAGAGIPIVSAAIGLVVP
jgi:hypothetical protein